MGKPTTFIPSKGVNPQLDRIIACVSRTRRSRSTSTTSASMPTASRRCGVSSRSNGFLVLESRFPKVDLGVDHTGKDVQTARLDPLCSDTRSKGAQCRDSSIAHPKICLEAAPGRDASPPSDQQIERLVRSLQGESRSSWDLSDCGARTA